LYPRSTDIRFGFFTRSFTFYILIAGLPARESST